MATRSPFTLSHSFPVTLNNGKKRLEVLLSTGCSCGGTTATVRKRQRSNGVWIVAVQCAECGAEKSDGLRRADFQDFDSLEVFDEGLSQRYFENLRQSIPLVELNRVSDKAEWQRRYDEFLRSREWYLIREYIIERDKRICQGCGTPHLEDPYNLRAHHLTYQYGFAPPLWLIKTVCIPCHDRLHADKHGLKDAWCPQG
jgi:5-methylcytosine-specific restriction endonuclease McrA